MFEKLKQLKDLRSQAKTMQSALANEFTTTEKNNVKLVMNGNLEITELTISENMEKERMQTVLKEVANEAIKKTQKLMAQKMQEMGGLGGLSDMLK